MAGDFSPQRHSLPLPFLPGIFPPNPVLRYRAQIGLPALLDLQKMVSCGIKGTGRKDRTGWSETTAHARAAGPATGIGPVKGHNTDRVIPLRETARPALGAGGPGSFRGDT
jgi:hypothetical protein